MDGENVFEPYLIRYGAEADYTPQNLQRECALMGMDCFKFVFYHADLAPGNILVEEIPETGDVGIIDWEVAGFFPRGWIRTKFRISSGLDLPDSATDT
ncbi:phosphotransferase, partial [Streptomyces javensis]|nr:phosphotransferase [Streptomyces javensis]